MKTIHILEFNFDDARGPESPYNWHHHYSSDYPSSACDLFLNNTDAWIPVCITMNEDYEKEFKEAKELLCKIYEKNPNSVKKRWLKNER